METTIQIVLMISVISLTIIFLIIGIFVVLIVRDIRGLTKRLEKIGENVGEASLFFKDKIKESFDVVSILSSLIVAWTKGGVKKIISQKIDGLVTKNDEEMDIQEEVEEKEIKKPLRSKKKFFFKRNS